MESNTLPGGLLQHNQHNQHNRPARESLVSSGEVPVTKRGRKFSTAMGVALATGHQDERHQPADPSEEDNSLTPRQGMMASVRTSSTPSCKESAKNEIEGGHRSEQQARQETVGLAAASRKHHLPATNTGQVFARATPATPSPPHLPAYALSQQSPARYKLPAPVADAAAPLGQAAPAATGAPPWATTSIRPSSTDSVTHMAYVVPPSLESSLESKDGVVCPQPSLSALDLKEVEERILGGGYDFSSDARRATTAVPRERIHGVLEFNAGGRVVENDTRGVVGNIRNDHPGLQAAWRAADNPVGGRRELAHTLDRGAHRSGLLLSTPTLRYQHQHQHQQHANGALQSQSGNQHQWPCPQPRPLSPSVVCGTETANLRARAVTMDASPPRSSDLDGGSGLLLSPPEQISSCTTAPHDVENMSVISSCDEVVVTGNGVIRGGGGRDDGGCGSVIGVGVGVGGEVFSGISAETAAEMSAALVEAMGGADDNSTELFGFHDAHPHRRQHQHQHQQQDGFELDERSGGEATTASLGLRRHGSWRSQQLLWPQGAQGSVAAHEAEAFPSDIAGMLPNTIPPISRSRDPVTVGPPPQHHQQPQQLQLHNVLDNIAMAEPVNSLGGQARFRAPPPRHHLTTSF